MRRDRGPAEEGATCRDALGSYSSSASHLDSLVSSTRRVREREEGVKKKTG
jgi:hypothetical protein